MYWCFWVFGCFPSYFVGFGFSLVSLVFSLIFGAFCVCICFCFGVFLLVFVCFVVVVLVNCGLR